MVERERQRAGHHFAFGNTEEKYRVNILGCRACGRQVDGPFKERPSAGARDPSAFRSISMRISSRSFLTHHTQQFVKGVVVYDALNLVQQILVV